MAVPKETLYLKLREACRQLDEVFDALPADDGARWRIGQGRNELDHALLLMKSVPPPCSDECMNGPVVLVTHSVPPDVTEQWVQQVAATAGQPVDWHFVGGRIVVRTSAAADLTEVHRALSAHETTWSNLYRQHVGDEFGGYVPWDLRSVPEHW